LKNIKDFKKNREELFSRLYFKE
jgi:hypothetical protein